MIMLQIHVLFMDQTSSILSKEKAKLFCQKKFFDSLTLNFPEKT